MGGMSLVLWGDKVDENHKIVEPVLSMKPASFST
jgi:hypothetical protein